MAAATVSNNQANFSTTGRYVNLPSGLLSSYAAFTVEVWVSTAANSGYTRIFQVGQGTSNSNSFALYRDAGKCRLTWFNLTGESNCFSSASFDNQVNMHVVITASVGDYARLYVNGLLKGSTPGVVTQMPPSSTFYIGKSFSPYDPGLIGSVNEFRIWDGAMSAADIASRYSRGPGECMGGERVLQGPGECIGGES